MSVDPRMRSVRKHLRLSLTGLNHDVELSHLQVGVTELANIVETLLPQPDPEPTPEDRAAMEAAGVESFKGARAKLFGVAVTAAEFEDLQERYAARISTKNAAIRSLEERIFNQRRELAVLNEKQSENTQVMGWLAAIANADKDVEAGLAAGKALSEFAQTLRAA